MQSHTFTEYFRFGYSYSSTKAYLMLTIVLQFPKPEFTQEKLDDFILTLKNAIGRTIATTSIVPTQQPPDYYNYAEKAANDAAKNDCPFSSMKIRFIDHDVVQERQMPNPPTSDQKRE